MNLGKAVNLFLGDYKPSTRESYKHALLMLVDYLGEDHPVERIRPASLLEFHHDRLVPRGYADATLRKHIKTVKTFFNWLVRMDEIDKTPAHIIKAKRLPMYVSRDKAMTDDELAVLLDYLRFKPRDYALVLFLADTGCRIGGAANCKVEDLDLTRRTGRVTEKGEITRPVRYGVLCAVAIERWLAVRKNKGEYVFSRGYKPMKADNISLMLRRACKVVGIRTLSGHSLRHRKGHQLADARVAPSIAATALGHSDPTITLMHYYPADWASAERALDELVTIYKPSEHARVRGYSDSREKSENSG